MGARRLAQLTTEIRIHRSLKHTHVVDFRSYFEDKDNVYMIMELCESSTLAQLVKKRKRLSEPEVQYYMSQLLAAVSFMHERHIIHRDLKLGNLFLSRALEIKVGDFGLATVVEHEGQRKRYAGQRRSRLSGRRSRQLTRWHRVSVDRAPRATMLVSTLCGTPNYIAPEVLDDRNGHSYEVDIWSLGVIMFVTPVRARGQTLQRRSRALPVRSTAPWSSSSGTRCWWAIRPLRRRNSS